MKVPTRCLAALLAGLAMPALAAEKEPEKSPSPSLSDLGHAFKNALTEEETRLLIEYMRDSILATFKDEEVTLPPDLAFKLEVLMQRLKKESNYYLDNWLKQLEQDIKRSLKEKMEVPPPVPYTPPEVPLLVPAMKAPATPPPPTPAAVYVAPPTNFNPAPWGYVPWFYIPQPNYQVPEYTPPAVPKFPPPSPNEADRTK